MLGMDSKKEAKGFAVLQELFNYGLMFFGRMPIRAMWLMTLGDLR